MDMWLDLHEKDRCRLDVDESEQNDDANPVASRDLTRGYRDRDAFEVT